MNSGQKYKLAWLLLIYLQYEDDTHRNKRTLVSLVKRLLAESLAETESTLVKLPPDDIPF